ncbi:hypothetical protein BO71DRAFT_435291 [Aspergillus ellipticus CBS 707.79]|uniref:Uncharacterized protein n=1 Tax=Aspergillus ellipticus CBS 707.79 TaxID=1448320 RepID=A0A319CWN5_9EURO|nr:hypothetical protein BO71DRAFT_435291 [Aspergillus ellipticus CBS 707.79]
MGGVFCGFAVKKGVVIVEEWVMEFLKSEKPYWLVCDLFCRPHHAGSAVPNGRHQHSVAGVDSSCRHYHYCAFDCAVGFKTDTTWYPAIEDRLNCGFVCFFFGSPFSKYRNAKEHAMCMKNRSCYQDGVRLVPSLNAQWRLYQPSKETLPRSFDLARAYPAGRPLAVHRTHPPGHGCRLDTSLWLGGLRRGTFEIKSILIATRTVQRPAFAVRSIRSARPVGDWKKTMEFTVEISLLGAACEEAIFETTDIASWPLGLACFLSSSWKTSLSTVENRKSQGWLGLVDDSPEEPVVCTQNEVTAFLPKTPKWASSLRPLLYTSNRGVVSSTPPEAMRSVCCFSKRGQVNISPDGYATRTGSGTPRRVVLFSRHITVCTQNGNVARLRDISEPGRLISSSPDTTVSVSQMRQFTQNFQTGTRPFQ